MLIIFGPTGVGKTDCALRIAQEIPAEIVNIDSGQMYTPLSIGVAKPDWRSSSIAHHLFDILDEPKSFSAAAYRKIFIDTVNSIWARGKLPIIVGGSGFYVKSIFFPLSDVHKVALQTSYDVHDNLWEKLHAIDPQRAASIHPHDIYRIKRALDIWYATKKKPSEHHLSFDPPSDFLLLCLMRERKDLYDRINQRVFNMIDEGWLEEVRALQDTPWELFLRDKKVIGYSELLDYLTGAQTEECLKSVIATIQQRTRHYAKRQFTFWKNLEKTISRALMAKKDRNALILPHIESINLTLLDLDLYIKQLSNKLSELFLND